MAIRLDTYDRNRQHFVVRADEPVRVEVEVVDGKVLAHVYKGTDDDLDQDPVGAYDGSESNTSWEHA
jgi:hypothetical protein